MATAKKKPTKKAAKPVAKPEPAAEDDQIDGVPGRDATLAERIIWVRNRVTRLGKDAQVGTGNYAYKGISHDKVTAFIRPKLNQAGILIYMTLNDQEVHETGVKTNSGRPILQTRCLFDVTFQNAYSADDNITITVSAFADDNGDKAPGKAQSYAFKYALLKMFMIETGEEDEARTNPNDGGERTGIIGDDEKAMADVWATADELYGDDAKAKLKAMAKRRFFVDNYTDIPIDRLADVFRALKSNHAREQREKQDAAKPKDADRGGSGADENSAQGPDGDDSGADK